MMPAAFSGAMNLAGLPAEVVTNLTPESQTKRSIASSLQESDRQVDAERQAAGALICAISRLAVSVSPDEVSMMPRPPARDTAEASCVRAIQPIGACTMG